MADGKKYDGSQWEHSLRKLTTATADIEPTIYTDGTAITAYTLKGNTTQSGTPTPANPVTVQGTGDKTANSYSDTIRAGGWGGTVGNVPSPNPTLTTRLATNDIFHINNTKTYTIAVFPSTLKVAVMRLASDNTIISDSGWSDSNYQTISNAYGFVATIRNSSGTVISLSDCEGIVLTEGSTAPLSYIPFGYKIPISSGQGSAVNYLGSVQSTRQIKKLVLTGEETVAGSAVTGGWIITNLSDSINNTAGVQTAYCSHYEAKENGAMSGLTNGEMCISTQYNNRINFVTSFSSATDFQAYLAQQYANGTPVTVWYVLATPQTAVVNEPLMKIGDYSDSISNATAIPTTEGANSITVDTTVQPSEFSATWTGWHDSSVKEYDGSQWQ